MNYRSLNFLAIVLVLILIPAVVQGLVGAWVFVPLALGYLLMLGWGVFDIGSQFFTRTIWKGNTDQVAFTFDDGPHPEHTPKILQILRKENVKATFFCIGRNAEAYPELLRKIVAEGHTLGNHTYHHSHRFGLLAQRKLNEDVSMGKRSIQHVTGLNPRFFRPPFGVVNPNVARTVNRNKDVIIGWDLRSLDGIGISEKQILKRVMPRIDRATLLLFHDTNPNTANVIRKVIRHLKATGRQIVPLEDLTGEQPYHSYSHRIAQ